MRSVLLFTICLLTVVATQARHHYSPEKYILRYAPIAVNMMHTYGIPASIIMGVAILESGFGNSKNAKLLNNHFGLIGRNQLKKNGIRYRSVYKQFESDTLSFDYFSRTLVKKKYYPGLKGKLHYKLWLAHIHINNYARAKRLWVRRIAAIIRKYHLHRFDLDLRIKQTIQE